MKKSTATFSLPIMKPYFEVGYGIGTYLFNLGLFWGGQVNKPDAVGVKFTFEIFN